MGVGVRGCHLGSEVVGRPHRRLRQLRRAVQHLRDAKVAHLEIGGKGGERGVRGEGSGGRVGLGGKGRAECGWGGRVHHEKVTRSEDTRSRVWRGSGPRWGGVGLGVR